MFKHLKYILNTSWTEIYADWLEYDANRMMTKETGARLKQAGYAILDQPGLKSCITIGLLQEFVPNCDDFEHGVHCEQMCRQHRYNHKYVNAYNATQTQRNLVKNFWKNRMQLRQKYLTMVDANTRASDLQEYQNLSRAMLTAMRKLKHYKQANKLTCNTSNKTYAGMIHKTDTLNDQVLFFWGRRMSQRVK